MYRKRERERELVWDEEEEDYDDAIMSARMRERGVCDWS